MVSDASSRFRSMACAHVRLCSQYCQTWVTLSESFKNDEVTPLHWFEPKVRNSTPRCLGPAALPAGSSATPTTATNSPIVQRDAKEQLLQSEIAHFRRIRVLDRLPLEWARMLEAMRVSVFRVAMYLLR